MAMQRYQDWQSRLARFLAAPAVFRWGQFDCGLFSAAWILEATGADFGARFRGRYDDAVTAQRVMKAEGFGDMAALATGMLGAPLPVVAKAQRGDIVLADERTGGCLGVIDLTGRRFAALTEKNGLVYLPRSRALTGWRV